VGSAAIASESYGKCGTSSVGLKIFPQFAGITPSLKFLRFPEIAVARRGRDPL
jgi:hypothetical protein